jgi:tRNA threonylcarbamoyladenosine biosynthesis protein TsaE
MIAFRSRSSEITEAFAAAVGERLAGGEILALEGPLGAGKTCFVRGLARGLGIDGKKVRSPSFAIHHGYSGGRLVLDHFDAYFVRESAEFERDGIEDFVAAGHVVVVEWADRFPGEFAAADLVVRIAVTGEEERQIELAQKLAPSLATLVADFGSRPGEPPSNAAPGRGT